MWKKMRGRSIISGVVNVKMLKILTPSFPYLSSLPCKLHSSFLTPTPFPPLLKKLYGIDSLKSVTLPSLKFVEICVTTNLI